MVFLSIEIELRILSDRPKTAFSQSAWVFVDTRIQATNNEVPARLTNIIDKVLPLSPLFPTVWLQPSLPKVAANDPMSRTYIGPFGRILPVPDGREPERQQVPDDETRTNMATYQLPPPDRLQFGTDTSPGFTEPMRYNTISKSCRSRPPSNPTYAEQAQQAQHLRYEQLPSVRQLLTTSTQPSAPQSPSLLQRSPNPSQRLLKLTDHRAPLTNQAVGGSAFPRQSTHFQPQLLPTQMPPPTNVSPPSRRYQTSPLAQQFRPSYMHHQGPSISHYAPPFETSQQMWYATKHQQALPPTFSQHQQLPQPNTPQHPQATPSNRSHPQQALGVNAPAQYHQDQPSNHETTVKSAMTVEQSPPATANSIKPLPRVIGEQDVPGEGPSWVYEDGTTCKKVINGEEVNAQWGVTKAGKPRKRLAIACTTCREKKIKCDPAEPKCVQCEKFGRECKFTTASPVERGSPGSPSYDFQARTSLMKIEPEPSPALLEAPSGLGYPQVEDQKPLKRRNSSPETRVTETILSNNDKFNKTTGAQRQRSSLPGLIVSKTGPKPRALKTSHFDPEPRCPREIELAKVDIDSFGRFFDPFELDGYITSHCLEAYLIHIGDATYPTFPRKPSLRWTQKSERRISETS